MNELDELIKLAGELYGKLKAYKERRHTKKEETTKEEDVVDLDELKSWF